MAISATFEADFSQFVAAAEKANGSLSQIQTTSKNVEGSFASLVTAAEGVAASMGLAFSVGAVVNFASALVENAQALDHLSEKTGISLQGLQRLQMVGDETATSIDSMTLAINQMQKRLVGDNASADAALRQLGLSFSDLRSQTPDQQFMTIAAAIREVQDPAQQVAEAMALFGRSGAEVLPAIKHGFDDVKDAAVGMSDNTVHALKDAGDAWDRFWRQAKGEAATDTIAVWKALGAAEGNVVISEAELAGAIPLTVQELAALSLVLPKVHDATKSLSLSTADQAAIEKTLNSEIAETVAANKEEEKTTNDIITAMEKVHVLALNNDRKMLAENAKLEATQLAVVNDAIVAEFEARVKDNAAMGQYADGTLKISSAYETYRITLLNLNAMKQAGIPITEQLAAADRALAAGLQAEADAANTVLVTGTALSGSLERGAAVAKGTAQAFDGLTVSIRASADQMAQYYAVSALGSNVGTPGADNIGVPGAPGAGSLSGAAAAALAILHAPHHAAGGPVSEGPAYLHDNEYVVPSGGALVMRGGGGDVTVNLTVHGSVVTERGLVQLVKDSITKDVLRWGPVQAVA